MASTSNMTGPSRWEWLVIAGLCAFVIVATAQMGEKSYDDAYITLRYARNLVSGAGLSYLSGEPHLATTAPLQAILVAALASPWGPEAIPRIAQWTSGAALLALALLAWALGRPFGRPLAGAAAALAVVLNPIFYLFWGGESLLLLALVSGAVYLYCRGHEAWAGALVALATLTRGEGALLAIVLLVHSLAVHRRWPWRAAAAGAAVLIPWMVYSWQQYGAVLPGTLEAKMAQGRSGLWGPFLLLSLDWLKSFVVGSHRFPAIIPRPAYLVAVLLAAVGAVALARRPRFPFAGLIAWALLQVVGYSLIGAPFYYWYALPLVFALMLLIGIGVEESWDRLTRWRRERRLALGYLATLTMLLAIAWPAVTGGVSVWLEVDRPVSQGQALYVRTGRWLRQHLPPDATVGVFEIGFIGYYSERRLVEPTGLLDPAVAERVPRGEFKWAYRHYRPDCIVINPVRWYDWLGSVREEDWFVARYRRVAEIAEVGYRDSPMTIYCRASQPLEGETAGRR